MEYGYTILNRPNQFFKVIRVTWNQIWQSNNIIQLIKKKKKKKSTDFQALAHIFVDLEERINIITLLQMRRVR